MNNSINTLIFKYNIKCSNYFLLILINLIKEQYAIHGQLANLKFIFFGVLTGFCICLLICSGSGILRFDLTSESQGLKSNNNSVPLNNNNTSYSYYGDGLEGQCSHYKAPTKSVGDVIPADQQLLDSNPPSNHTEYDYRLSGGQLEKGVWFYANSFEKSIPFTIVDQLANLNVNTIYFAGTSISDWSDLKKFQFYLDFICYAYSKGLNVYAVTLEDPIFAFADEEQIKEEFRSFILLTKSLFDTFMIDVEPHTLRLSDPLVYVPKYIMMSLALQEISNKYNVTYVDTVPYWYHFVIKNIGISPGLNILGGDRINLMDYTYTANQSINNVNAVLHEIHKPVTISIKTTPGFGDPFLNAEELKSTIENFENNSVGIGLFESQYLLRNLP